MGYPGGLGGKDALIEEVEGVVFVADAAEGSWHLRKVRLPSGKRSLPTPPDPPLPSFGMEMGETRNVKILIFEDNLMWSERLRKTVKGLGHEAVVVSRLKADLPKGDVAILNLGSESLWSSELVASLKANGVFLIGHAGHKEKQKLEAGREVGIDQVVSNSTLTFKLDEVLAQVNTQ